jgi:hypothetical protein
MVVPPEQDLRADAAGLSSLTASLPPTQLALIPRDEQRLEWFIPAGDLLPRLPF